jgi:hypothetical protein
MYQPSSHWNWKRSNINDQSARPGPLTSAKSNNSYSTCKLLHHLILIRQVILFILFLNFFKTNKLVLNPLAATPKFKFQKKKKTPPLLHHSHINFTPKSEPFTGDDFRIRSFSEKERCQRSTPQHHRLFVRWWFTSRSRFSQSPTEFRSNFFPFP